MLYDKYEVSGLSTVHFVALKQYSFDLKNWNLLKTMLVTTSV